MDKPEIYTTDEVAIMLELSGRRIRRAADTLGVKKHGRDYLFTRADIERIRGRIGMQGKPLEEVGGQTIS
jgi:hypothetical protein